MLDAMPEAKEVVLDLGDYYQVYSDYSALTFDEFGSPQICRDIREYFAEKTKDRIPVSELEDSAEVELAHFLGYHLESEQDKDKKIYFKVVKNGKK